MSIRIPRRRSDCGALFRPLLGDIKGSIANLTFQGGRHGAIIRNRTKPVDPGTTKQGIIRSQLAAANVIWLDSFSQVQRDAWATYASGSPWKNKFGDTTFLTGRQQFIRSSVFYQQAGAVGNPDAPLTTGFPANPNFTLSINLGAIEIDDIQMSVSGTDAVGIFVSAAKNQTVNFFKKPWLTQKYEPSNTIVPLEIRAAALTTVGEKYFVGLRYLDDNGRLADQVLIKNIIVT